MQILEKINHLFMNKKVKYIWIIIGIAILCVCGYFIFHKPLLYKKLQGEYRVVWEYTEIYRNMKSRAVGSILEINKYKIIPHILSAYDKLEATDEEREVWANNQKGTWEIISENPDSILIETPASILNGKYAVFFEKEHPFGEPVSYLLILQNDSTRLCFSKIVLPYPNMEWE